MILWKALQNFVAAVNDRREFAKSSENSAVTDRRYLRLREVLFWKITKAITQP